MKLHISYIVTALLLVPSFHLTAQTDSILANFNNPPMEYRPKAWWHWIDGNITKDGIRKDLLWLKEAGIGGVQNFDAGLGVPAIVPQPLTFMDERWKDAFNYAVNLADSLGMDFGIASSGGWSDTGGPWVAVEDAMKTLNWKEMTLEGGRYVEAPLPQPNRICGKYLTHSFFPEHHPEYDFYRDIAVVAVKIPDCDISMEEMGVVMTASDGSDVSTLADGNLNNVCLVTPDAGGHSWIEFSFPEERTVRSFFLGKKDNWVVKDGHRWEVSDDGINFRQIEAFIPKIHIPFITIDIPETTGKHFRFINTNAGQNLDYTELRIYPVTKVNYDTEKAGFFALPGTGDRFPTPDFKDATPEEDVLDLTESCQNGILRWNALEGRWRIYRFGYTIRGRKNNPASEGARGLEIDKLDPDAMSRYYHTYFDLYNDACAGGLGSKLSTLVTDSFEAGCQTWTASMPEEFLKRRGYDLIHWLPALAGHIIGSSRQTDRFLQDWRQTVGEMLVAYHYDALGPILKEYGLKRYSEFHESNRHFPVDGMDVKRHADVPMSAFWPDGKGGTYQGYLTDIRESASVAHIYGQNVVTAESFSTNGDVRDSEGRLLAWNIFPNTLKCAADMAMAAGLNSFVFHSCIHQPTDDHIPGIALSQYGMWFQRHETWVSEARPWTDYLARSSYLLQQGSFVAEIAYLTSETINITDRFTEEAAPVPSGYSYDFVNRTVLESGEFGYRALIVDSEIQYMSIPVLKAIKTLVDRGILIAGSEPSEPFGLNADENEFHSLVDDIWHSGRRNVVSLNDLPSALASAGCPPDVEFGAGDLSQLAFVHRHLEDSELYWVTSFSDKPVSIAASFNIAGRKPYMVRADDGSVAELPYRMEGDRTIIPLEFRTHDAFFVLFKENTQQGSLTLPKPVSSVVATMAGSWDVSFSSSLLAPQPMRIDTLASLSESPVPEVKYFSGTATYTTSIKLKKPSKGSRYVISLGEVHSLARVRVNGIVCGTAWKTPYETDITPAVRNGVNTIEIEVINGWANRLIGDAQPGVVPVTWTNYRHYTADEPLHPSGLIGPVTIERIIQ